MKLNFAGYLYNLPRLQYHLNMPNKKIDSTTEELAIVIGLIIRKMRTASPSENEYSWTQKSIIARLDRDGPMTISDLARAEGIKSQSMGAAIDSLEKVKMVERRPHPTDGRRTNIHLTHDGSKMRKAARNARRTWLADAVSKLEKKEQNILTSAVDVLKRIAE